MSLRTLPNEDLLTFTSLLTTRDWRKLTKNDFKMIDRFTRSDGCSGVPDFHRNGCVIHDFWYRTHRNLDGTPISKRQADAGLRAYIMSRSWFGIASPMAWWRYAGVRLLADRAWS